MRKLSSRHPLFNNIQTWTALARTTDRFTSRAYDDTAPPDLERASPQSYQQISETTNCSSNIHIRQTGNDQDS